MLIQMKLMIILINAIELKIAIVYGCQQIWGDKYIFSINFN